MDGPERPVSLGRQGLANHLGTPLPYLLFRAQARYEEDLRGLRDMTGMLALNLGAPAPVDATLPVRTTTGPQAGSTSLMQRVLGSQAATPRVLSTRPSVPPTPQRLSTPSFVPSPRTSPPHGTHARIPTRESNPGSESTMTLIQKPIGPVAAPASSTRPTTSVASARRSSQDTESHSSSSSSSDGEDEEAQRQEEEEATRKRLQELERMMSSDMLGFARQQPRPITRTPALSGQSMIMTRPKSEIQAQQPSRPESNVGPVSANAASPPRGRPFPPSATRGTTWQPHNYIPTAAAQVPTYPSPSAAGNLDQRSQSVASSIASRSKSGHGSIPSIPSPGESQSPSVRSSTSANQSASPSATDNSRSPSMISPPPRADAIQASDRHVKRLSLDGAVRGRGGLSRGTSAHGHHQPGPRTASAQGSTTSSFSDISDMSMSASALEDALMSNINRGASSRL
ncbi:hypothetical protein FRB97_005273 [Tulasnella sp. 331]|nr:hypothetical protein FRB97_005273 [Tulasnella sp. 331]